jgi:putative SOS response-associated peptidase YedK
MRINVRSETVLEKPSFRKAAITCRALIPAEGYLRMAEGRGREEDPYHLVSEKDELLAFAGLYEFWPDPSLPEDAPGKWLLSCTVLTTTAHATPGQLHDRSPVSIPPDLF